MNLQSRKTIEKTRFQNKIFLKFPLVHHTQHAAQKSDSNQKNIPWDAQFKGSPSFFNKNKIFNNLLNSIVIEEETSDMYRQNHHPSNHQPSIGTLVV